MASVSTGGPPPIYLLLFDARSSNNSHRHRSSICCCNTCSCNTGCCNTSCYCHPKAAKITLVIVRRGVSMLQQQASSRFDNDTHESERRCNFRSQDVPRLGQLQVSHGGSVRTESGNNVKCCLRRGVGSVLCTPTTRHEGFDQKFAEGRRSGVEAGSRREQHIRTGDKIQRAEALVWANL